MTLQALMRALDDVAQSIPFSIDDYDAVNHTFMKWKLEGSREAYETLQKWLYCYSRRYFVVKFLRMPKLNEADIERPMTEAFRRARLHMNSVEKPDRFASYVSVVCKNVFITFCRNQKRDRRIEMGIVGAEEQGLPDDDPFEASDRSIFIYVVRAAILRLPEWLQEVAMLRFVDGKSYEEIEALTNHSKSTLRAYASKALMKLREDPLLINFLREWDS
jgi:RNA polymerase sigma factor (sigma-70 family)